MVRANVGHRAQDSEYQECGALRAVATFEFLKGALALLVAFGLLSLAQSQRDASDVVQGILRDLHVGADAHFARMLLRVAYRLDGANLVAAALLVLVYMSLRFVEAYGLWRARTWAEWMALISGAIYVPIEIGHVVERPGLLGWLTLIVNVLIVLYMAHRRMQSRVDHGWADAQRTQGAEE